MTNSIKSVLSSQAREMGGSRVFVGHLDAAQLQEAGIPAPDKPLQRHLVAVLLDENNRVSRSVYMDPLPTDVQEGRINWDERFKRGANTLGISF